MMNHGMSVAKLARPSLQNVYPRDGFFDLLDKCREKPVIWITAPPGAGKTTLISSYIEARKLNCLWYQVDSADKDPATFFHYMGLAAAQANARYTTPFPHLTPEYLLGLPKFSSEYFHEIYKRLEKKSLIVFDNYQEVPRESVLHEVIQHGLNHIPKGTNVVIISRTAPPPILSRLRLNQLMEVITYDELRLTADEVVGIASIKGMGVTSDDEARKLLSRTEGWAAGLVLMLEGGSKVHISKKCTERSSPVDVFGDIAGEQFKVLDRETQSILTKLSIFPVMSLEMAEGMTGSKKAGSVISDLVSRNYFVQTHQGDHELFQFHPLFRDFLYNQLINEICTEDLGELERKAAQIFVSNGYVDNAVTLFGKVEDWDSVRSLICEEAPGLLEQGRHDTLKSWISLIPEGVISKEPWLLFWKANSLFPFDQGQSRKLFEEAYEVFKGKNEASGILLSLSGIVESIVHGFDDFKPLDKWIGIFEDFLKKHPAFPSKEIESRVSLSMFLALSYRAPHHPDMVFWVDKTVKLLDEKHITQVHVQAYLFLVDYFIWIGDLKRADIIIEKLSRAISDNDLSPYVMIYYKLAESLSNWFHGRLDECITTVTEGLELADSTGVKVFNYFLYGHGAVALLTRGDLEGAKKYLDKASSVLDDNKRFCTSYYYHIAACHDLLSMNHSGAFEHEKLSHDLAVELGSPFAEAMTRTGLALIYYEVGENQQADSDIASAHELAKKIGSKLIEFVCYLFEAYMALDSGDRSRATERLKKALALGNIKGYLNIHMWRADIMTKLCQLAIENGIETDYVKRMVRERDLFHEDIPLELEDWPWPIKIHLFGSFAIYKNDALVKFVKKAPKKPIELLRLLIALGGSKVPEGKVSDALWPDSDGDAAHVVFTTTLNRLRNLLGVNDAIILSEGTLTLNPRYFWVDTWLFNHLLDKVNVGSIEGIDAEISRVLERAIEVYDGGFNHTSDDNPWELLFQERLRSKFICTVLKLGSYWEEAQEFEKAIACYRKGIEAEILSEELCQKLMICLDKIGRTEEALVTYELFLNVSKKIVGVEPSTETKKVLEQITNR